MSADKQQVLIVGAGPVGLLNALGLAQQGIEVTVIEREMEIGTAPRSMVHLFPVLPVFERLGLLDDMDAAGFRGSALNNLVLATGESLHMSVATLEGQVPYAFNIHLGQDELSRIVLRHLDRHDGVTVLRQAEATALVQDEDGVTVTVETPEGTRALRAEWVIGTDGARSFVRRAVGLGFDGMTWGERFVATNIRYDFEAHGYLRSNFVIDPEVGAIVAKITDDGLWRVTYQEDDSLPEDGILDRMPAFFERFLPGDGDYELDQWSPYRMHQRSAERYRVGRVLLAGDSAHATNPTGGMGLTSGVLDTAVLHEALAAVVRGEADDAVLDRYSEIRRGVFLNGASPAATENKRLVYDSRDPERLERDLVEMRAVAADPDLQRQRMSGMLGLVTPSLLTEVNR